MHVTHHQLRVFEAVARYGSFSRASQALFLTQPTVSVQVKQLSEAVGLPLFEQIGRKIYLTQAGKELYATCKQMFDTWSEFETRIADLKGLKEGRLRVSSVTTAEYFLPRLLGPFCDQYPGIDVTLEIGNRSTVVDRVAGNEDDLYIMGVPPTHLDVEQHIFLPNPLVVIAPVNHALATKKSIKSGILNSERLILREPGSGTRMVSDYFFKQHGIVPVKPIVLGSNEAIKQAVAGGLGIGIVSLHALSHEAAPQSVVVLDVQGFPIERHWYIVHYRSKKLSAVAQTFFDYLQSASTRITLPYLEKRK